MFTGIIECMGTVKDIVTDQTNIHFYIESSISNQLRVDQSVAHDGVCLTVVEVNETVHKVTAIDETLRLTTLGNWHKGSTINLERCTPVGGRYDGHIVQGHTDTTATCVERIDLNGSWLFRFKLPDDSNKNLMVHKGSITINGISLTLVEANEDSFAVAIIPYTFEHTNLNQVLPDIKVNIEFDILGKYIARHLQKI